MTKAASVRLAVAMAFVIPLGCAGPASHGSGSVGPTINLKGRRVQVPLSPRDSQRAFRVEAGFHVELVAAEPDVVDPVAMTFDENGRIYVAEMLDYPLVRTPGMFGPFPEGQIRLLDLDDEGKVARSRIFAQAITQPSSLVAWNGGVLVTAAPDILFLKDTDGDGYADERRPLLTGFDDSDDLYRVNSLNWGIDGWVYAHGRGDTPVRWGDDPKGPALSTEKMDLRFRPAEKLFEALSGESGCFGETLDDFGRRFFSNSSTHIHQPVLPTSALRRNPFYAPPRNTPDISDHGGAAPIFRISDPPHWRVERSRVWEATGKSKEGFWKIEGQQNYMTAVTGPEVYREALFPPEYHGNYFVAEASANLVHRDVIGGDGPALRASRVPADSEFLASADPWTTPTCVESGPDGALYVCDMYRQIIEHPLDVLPEILAKYGLRAGSTMGRLWRVTTDKGRFVRPALGRASPHELARTLDHPGAWWRTTAQRLILERPQAADVPAIEEVARSTRQPAARVQALWTLEALGKLPRALVLAGLGDAHPGVRENALQMAEPRLVRDPALAGVVLGMVGDPVPRVRFQVAIALGVLDPGQRVPALARIGRQDGSNVFSRAAVLTALGDETPRFCQDAVADGALEVFVGECAAVVGARLDEREIAGLLAAAAAARPGGAARGSVLVGLAKGISRRGRRDLMIPSARGSMEALLADAARPVGEAALQLAGLVHTRTAEEVRKAVAVATARALDRSQPEETRVAAARALGAGDFEAVSPAVGKLLAARPPPSLVGAALDALDAVSSPRVPDVIARSWKDIPATAQARAVAVALGRRERLLPALEAVARKQIPADAVDSTQRAQLLGFPDPAIAARAKAVFGLQEFDPAQFESAKGALGLAGDKGRGVLVYRQRCLPCHRANGEGGSVGPQLASVRASPREMILRNILYPSLMVQPAYKQYVVETAAGDIVSGVLTASNTGSVTIRRPAQEDAFILRKDIKTMTSTTTSVMPEGLLAGLKLEEIADLLEFLAHVE